MRNLFFAFAVLGVCMSVFAGENSIRLTDVARDSNGDIRHMNQASARQYCQDLNLRLPTARELALYAQENGAKGISETWKYGYYPVNAYDTSLDKFYFNNSSYQRPPNEPQEMMGSLNFWSSSVDSDSPGWGLVFNNESGHHYFTNKDNDAIAVRCIQSH
jgi:hypothetical protein